jgi:guanosine-3',5'-bis(diphosphate) 3'-pyrophosphohydrolase
MPWTRSPSAPRKSLGRRTVRNPIARAVKLADNTENMNLDRISEPTQRDFDRIAEYAKVRELLSANASTEQSASKYRDLGEVWRFRARGC